MHVCPMQTPGTPPIPHVGGPILPPGVPTVLIAGQPAAVVGGMATPRVASLPDSHHPARLAESGPDRRAAPPRRMGDMTAHGGSIVAGAPTVMIGP